MDKTSCGQTCVLDGQMINKNKNLVFMLTKWLTNSLSDSHKTRQAFINQQKICLSIVQPKSTHNKTKNNWFLHWPITVCHFYSICKILSETMSFNFFNNFYWDFFFYIRERKKEPKIMYKLSRTPAATRMSFLLFLLIIGLCVF